MAVMLSLRPNNDHFRCKHARISLLDNEQLNFSHRHHSSKLDSLHRSHMILLACGGLRTNQTQKEKKKKHARSHLT